MSNFKLGTTWAAAAILFSASVFTIARPAQAQDGPANLTIASFRQGSSWYVYAVNLAELLSKELPEGSTVDSPPIAGGLGNPLLVTENRADLAFGMAVVGNWAMQGKHAYHEPLDKLRGLIGGWDEYYLVPMARGNGFENDLAGFFTSERPTANVTLLSRGSIGAYGGEQLLEAAKITQDSVDAAGGGFEYGSFDMVKTRFASGTGDVFIQVATRGHPGITEIAQQNTLTFLQPSDSVLTEMTERFGWGRATLPAETFLGQDKGIELPGTTTMLFASTDMSDNLAYTIVKTVCENTNSFQSAHKALSSFDCETNGVWRGEVNGMPMHEGALRYFRERGWIE